ncbi:hypothetical protein CCACVL1_28325 [Corchorus capsularis]|uniref:Uncharacterized protein n=1 Tax=Corchorus capsularis TaxID=210143 RepID=A0A1R3G6U6_COCAP|nr:hypothetical protein CCACVL1_28325 [Corchorus capsularis]
MSLIAKVACIMLLLVAVQAQEFFPSSSSSEDSSLLSEFDFPEDFNSPPAPVTNQFSLETQSDDADQNSLFSESEFPADSEVPFESQDFPMETDSLNKKLPLPPYHRHHSPPPSPSKTPLPDIAPSPSQVPFSAPKSCKPKCAKKCSNKEVPLLHNLCTKACRRRCFLTYAQMIYKCTNKCAESMPKNFNSDGKKAAEYVNNCYKKCVKKY